MARRERQIGTRSSPKFSPATTGTSASAAPAPSAPALSRIRPLTAAIRIGTRAAARPAAAAGRFQNLVSPHDLRDLAVAVRAQRGFEQLHDRGPLRRGEVSHPESLSLEHRAREVRPAPALRVVVERELDLASAGVIKGRQHCIRRRDDGGGGGRRAAGDRSRRGRALRDDAPRKIRSAPRAMTRAGRFMVREYVAPTPRNPIA